MPVTIVPSSRLRATSPSLSPGKTHDGERTLFSGLLLNVAKGERLSLVGPNGSGKSSLLACLAGADSPTSGVVTRKKGLSIGYLPQDPPLPEDLSVLECVLSTSGGEVARTARDYEAALLGELQGTRRW